MTIEAMRQAFEAFKKIHEGCGEVKKDNLSKESNELATLVRKDCTLAMIDLSVAIKETTREWTHLTDEEFDQVLKEFSHDPRAMAIELEIRIMEKNT